MHPRRGAGASSLGPADPNGRGAASMESAGISARDWAVLDPPGQDSGVASPRNHTTSATPSPHAEPRQARHRLLSERAALTHHAASSVAVGSDGPPLSRQSGVRFWVRCSGPRALPAAEPSGRSRGWTARPRARAASDAFPAPSDTPRRSGRGRARNPALRHVSDEWRFVAGTDRSGAARRIRRTGRAARTGAREPCPAGTLE
jgi:hypothetical protein